MSMAFGENPRSSPQNIPCPPIPYPRIDSPTPPPAGEERDTPEKIASANDAEDMLRCGPVSHEEARNILQRFIDGHFNNAGRDKPRMTIPADPRRDDDLRLIAYIRQQRHREEDCIAAGFLTPDGVVRRVHGTLAILASGEIVGNHATVWVNDTGDIVSGRVDNIGVTFSEGFDSRFYEAAECYSTRESATAALAGKGEKP